MHTSHNPIVARSPRSSERTVVIEEPHQLAGGVPGLLHHRPVHNGGTEAINGLIELHRRVARGFRNRDNYRLRMLLIGGGLSHPQLK